MQGLSAPLPRGQTCANILSAHTQHGQSYKLLGPLRLVAVANTWGGGQTTSNRKPCLMHERGTLASRVPIEVITLEEGGRGRQSKEPLCD
eukprot:14211326-Alexandrium_andersonii.AAC.2